MISGKLLVVETVLDFKSFSNIDKCSLKLSDSPLLLETMQSFSEIIILLEKLLCLRNTV